MSAATIYSDKYDSNGRPLNIPKNPWGITVVPFSLTIPTTSTDDVGDRAKIAPIPDGVKQVMVWFNTSADGDSGGPTLDVDLIVDDFGGAAGIARDTILYNAGTAFGAGAIDNKLVINTTGVVGKATQGYGHLGLLVNAAAATGVEFVISGVLMYQ